MARSIIARASRGLVANVISCGTWAAARRAGSSVQAFGPGLGKIKGTVDEGMPVPGDIGREHADLTVGDLAGRARVLAPHPAGGPPLLEKAGLVYDQHRTRIGQGLKGIVAHQIAQRLGVPLSPAEQRLLAPGARIARRLRPHPARLAPLR